MPRVELAVCAWRARRGVLSVAPPIAQRKSAKFKVEAEQHKAAATEAQALAASRCNSTACDVPSVSAAPSEDLTRAASSGASKAEAALGPLQLELSDQRELATSRLEEVRARSPARSPARPR